MPRKQKTLETDFLKSRVSALFFPENGNEHSKTVGLELEVWPFRHTERSPIELVRFLNEEGTGLIQLLQKVERNVDGMSYEPSADGAHRFKFEAGGQLTFEPGGQLEYSGPPKKNLAEAIGDITFVIETLRCNLKKYDIWFFHSALNPWYSVDEVGLQIRKDRYLHMNNYFKAKGPYGQKMMRLSTSLQVNLDAGNPETAQRRWLAANLLAPVFTALFGNSPFVEGKAAGAYSYRSIIWQNLDPTRTGFQKEFLAPEYKPCPVAQYFDFALDAHCMRLPDQTGSLAFDGAFVSFRDWLTHGINGYYPDMEDWEIHLSTLFPEVRARGFFEVRYLDAQSKVWCSVPGVLLTHLLYDEKARERVIQLLAPYRTDLPAMLREAAINGMTDADLAGLAKRIYKLGLDAAGQEEASSVMALCEAFYHHYGSKDRNPATDLLELNGGNLFTPAQYRDFERGQVDRVGELLDMICEYI